ncbi:MAG: hypothetical protein WAM24_05510 [Ignavibacteriaceae bacterium]
MWNLKTLMVHMILFVSVSMLSAQTLNLQNIPNDKMQFGISYNKAFYSTAYSDYKMSTLSGVYQLNANIPISSKLNIIGDIPYVITNFELNFVDFSQSFSENGIGNIFIGLQTNSKLVNNKKSIFTFGLYLPTCSENGAVWGLLADDYFFPKYYPNSFSIYFNYAYHKIDTQGLNYGLELGPDLLIPTKSSSNETELLIHYGVVGGYQIDKLLLNLEFLGFGIITEHTDNIGDRFINMVNIGAQWKGSTITPKIFYKIYLRDEIRHTVDGVLGLGATVSID